MMGDKNGMRISDDVRARFLPSLEEMGYRILSSGEQKLMREGDETAVLLTTVLREQLIRLNTVEINSVREARFSQEEIEAGIKALQAIVTQGEYLAACREVYELITQGKVFRQETGGGFLSFTMHYVDWNRPSRNVWHVAEKFCVERGEQRFYSDYVLFVNGIPLCVIVWSDMAWRGGLERAVQQQVACQKTEGIRDLYAYAQLLLAVASDTVRCATNGLQPEAWMEWHEWEREYGNERSVPLPALCEPGRMLELVYRFILLQGERKILARYYHYFIVKKILRRIGQQDQRWKGGVVCQPQGSGKFLTMLLLTRAIRMNEQIRNPKIFWVADRVNTDRQSAELMSRCGLPFISADTGRSLAGLLQSDRDVVVTTTLQKFATAVHAIRTPLESAGIFVLLEEGQRSQLGAMGYRLGRILPDACFIAFTGLPVIDERMQQRFGEVIAAYPIGRAIGDKVLSPVLYERRYLPEEVCDEEERIEKISRDIAAHFECHYKGTGLKGVVVCQNQREAVKYKAFFDRIGKLNAEVMPGRNKEEEEYGKKVSVWEKTKLLCRFQEETTPEVLIMDDCSFTALDVSCDVLYLVNRVSPESYLQMVGRINRVSKLKNEGRLIDYRALGSGTFRNPEALSGEISEALIQSVETVFYRLDQLRAGIREIMGGMPEWGQDLRKLGDTFREAGRRIAFYTCLDDYEEELRKVADDCSEGERKEKIQQYKANYQCFIRLRDILFRRFAEQSPEEDPVAKVLPDKILAWALMADVHVFRQEMEEAGGLLAQADTLAYRIRRGVECSNRLELVYREKVLKVLDEIFACYERNGDEQEYFNRVSGFRLQLLNHLQAEKLPEDSVLSAYRGVLQKLFIGEEKAGEFLGEAVLETDRIVRRNIYEAGKIIVDWQRKETLINRLKRELVDYLIVFLSAGNRREISYAEVYGVAEQCVGKAMTGNYESE